MKRSVSIIFICLIYIISFTVHGSKAKFPDEEIKNIPIIELTFNELYDFASYVKIDLDIQKKYVGVWSTLHHINLDMLKITTEASSSLGKNYSSSNICDGKLDTAWVEGAKGNGIGEWVKISLQAKKESPSSTPFTVDKIGVICGYTKNQKTWSENNRVKSLIVVVHSPSKIEPQEYEWVVYRLSLKDDPKLQLFKLSDKEFGVNIYPMVKDVWIKIEDVYPGTKYDDTCISELVIIGGCLP